VGAKKSLGWAAGECSHYIMRLESTSTAWLTEIKRERERGREREREIGRKAKPNQFAALYKMKTRTRIVTAPQHCHWY